MSTAELLPITDDATFVTEDGYIVRESDGEVLGLAGAPETFRVDNPDAADWVLSKIAEEEAEVLALTARLEALHANLNRMRKVHANRVNFLRWKFAPELEAFARSQLTGKSRTLTLPHGSIAIRRVPESFKVGDLDKTIAYVEGIDPSLVRVTKAVTTKEAKQAAEFIGESLEDVPGLVRTPEHETVTVRTGIE